MRKLILLFGIALLASFALGQNQRVDIPFPSISPSTSTAYLVANVPPNSPLLSVCHSPANAVPCTNYTTTFNGLGVSCPNGAQDTPNPSALTSACQSTGDTQGNLGFWIPSGTYDYTVCISNTCLGPYTITVGGAGGGSGPIIQVNGSPTATQNLLNFIAGSNMSIVPNGTGGLTFTSSGGGGTPALPFNAFQYNNNGSFGSTTCTWNSSTLTQSCPNLAVTSSLIISGVYQALGSANPLVPLATSTVGLTNFGVNSDHCLAESANAGATTDLLNFSGNLTGGEPLIFTSGNCPTATTSASWVDIGAQYGNVDLCVAIAAGKTAHLTDGVTLDGRSFGSQGAAIKCGVSTYVAGYQGQILLPAGTINVQGPNLFMLQTRSDVTGQGEDATFIKGCITGNANCNGVFFPSAATPTNAVVEWTDDGVGPNYNANPTFDTRLSKVTIDCGQVTGTTTSGMIGLANFVAQENLSGPRMVTIHDCGNHSWDYAYGGANIVVVPAPVGTPSSTSTTTACSGCIINQGTANVAGDTNLVCSLWNTSGGLPTFVSYTDTPANQYATAGSTGSDGVFLFQCAEAQGIKAHQAGNAISLNLTGNTGGGGAASVALIQSEFQNIISLGTLNAVSAPTVTTTSNPSCPSVTSTVNGAIIVCAIEAEANGATYAAGGGGGGTLIQGTALQGMQYFTQTSAGAKVLTWTSATTRRAIAISMAFAPGTNNGPGSQNHVVEGLDVFIGNGEISTADSLLISGDTGAIGIAGPKTVKNVTATVNNGFTGTAPTELIRVCGTATSWESIHLENPQGANSYGMALGEDCGFTGITINNLNAGNMSSATALLFLSNIFPSNSLTVTNLNEVGPNYSTDLMIDQLNAFTDLTANETKISLYSFGINGCRFSGSGTGQCILTTSAFLPSTFGNIDVQLFTTDYNCASQFGDGQAGAASQFPCTFGFTTIPIGWSQIVVSTNAVVSNATHIQIQDDPAAVAYYGGFPATCNTAQFLNFKITAKTGWSATPFVPYPVQTVTSSALVGNVVTLTGTFSGFGTPSATNAFVVRHLGDSTSALNTLGLVTGGNGTTTLTYALIAGNTTGTGGTVQIVPGFAATSSAAVSTTAECIAFTIFGR